MAEQRGAVQFTTRSEMIAEEVFDASLDRALTQDEIQKNEPMQHHRKYVIASGFTESGPPDEAGIDYIPDSRLPIAIWDYARTGPDFNGAGLLPSEALRYKHTFQRMNAEWFFPFLERMATGETVPIEEINARHVELFGQELQGAEE